MRRKNTSRENNMHATRTTMLARGAALTLAMATISVVTTAGTAHAENARDYVCKASSSASPTDSGGRDAIATSRNKNNGTRFFRIEFVADGEIMRVANVSVFNSIDYTAYFQGTGKEWYWHLSSGETKTDNLDLPEGHNVAINANPSVPGFNCGTNGGRT
ncbi:hypothetical protein ACFXOR_18880 [Streptomyces sp. NPDC059164]|uniref:hypothetical protein n=1 Tax=unclassified Streptomyces TaxID=2593676 RepID=UPI003677AEA7